ncbi:hypothetical protein KM620_gp130 [Hyposidra talaca nucleopolyhedrovirus]|uniref:Uncharacterized protein n=1 Tax=Hyposidra talaca nucleopolyhedrovirus TaxID=1070315 RepID=A0A2Z4HI71_9ABAC|nr:hypothetical protein KM620_gp130 [Hyposidra talaca nucleopolyhedrovirus]AWW14490.1 hypothetical protein HytaNPV_gp130 [Hyposidra talaca nucleopolyhedrovirus]
MATISSASSTYNCWIIFLINIIDRSLHDQCVHKHDSFIISFKPTFASSAVSAVNSRILLFSRFRVDNNNALHSNSLSKLSRALVCVNRGHFCTA